MSNMSEDKIDAREVFEVEEEVLDRMPVWFKRLRNAYRKRKI